MIYKVHIYHRPFGFVEKILKCFFLKPSHSYQGIWDFFLLLSLFLLFVKKSLVNKSCESIGIEKEYDKNSMNILM